MTEDTTMTEGSAKIRGGFNSRNRRKSKYLSYPYTNIGSIHKDLAAEREELRTPCLSNKIEASSIDTNRLNGTPSFIKVGSKRWNWYKKFIRWGTMCSSPEFINASSGELLSGLYSKAVDCMFPVEDKSFNPVEWFFCKYRVSQYHDEAELATCLIDVKGGGIGKPVDSNLLDIKSEKRIKNNKMKNVAKRKMKSLSGLSDINISISTCDSLRCMSKLKKKRKVEEVSSLHHVQDVEMTLNDRSSKRWNWYKKFIRWGTMCSSPEFINASSGELLSGLYSKAVDCMFPVEDKSFNPVEWFFCKYRVSQYHDEAELATCLIDVKGGGIGKPVDSNLLDIKSEKRIENNKMKNVAKRKVKSLSGLSDINISISTCDSLRCVSKLKKKRKVEEVSSLHHVQDVEMTLNDRSSNFSSVSEAPQNLTCLTSKGKTGPERKENTEAAQEHQSASIYTDAKCTKCSSLVMDMQLMSPPIPSGIPEKSTVEYKDEQVLIGSNPEFCISQDGLVGNNTNHSLLVSTTSEVGIVSVNNIGLNNRMDKAAEKHLNTKLAMEIPDLNVSSESNSIRKEFFETVNIISPELKSEQSRSLSACLSPTEASNHNTVEDNGTCLLLQFSPDVHIPSKEDLMTAFCRFGPLKASETQLLKDTHSAQIVFVRSADAGQAFHSLEQNKPFGATLVDYRLHHLSVASPLVERFVAPTQPIASMPLPGEARPSLQFIRQNLQMMASVMENSGNNLSPRMRAKLENEINNLLKKVNQRLTFEQ